MPRSKSTSDHRRSRISRSRQPVKSRSRIAAPAKGEMTVRRSLFRNMLGGRFGFVHRPGDAYRLGLDERCAEPFEFLRRQVIARVRVSGNLSIPRAGFMMAGREQAALFPEREHRRKCRQGAVRRHGMAFPDLAMKLGDRRPADGVARVAGRCRGRRIDRDSPYRVRASPACALARPPQGTRSARPATVTASRASARATAGS